MVVWRSMASVTTAGDGGSELANDSGDRAGVRAGTTGAEGVVFSVSVSSLLYVSIQDSVPNAMRRDASGGVRLNVRFSRGLAPARGFLLLRGNRRRLGLGLFLHGRRDARRLRKTLVVVGQALLAGEDGTVGAQVAVQGSLEVGFFEVGVARDKTISYMFFLVATNPGARRTLSGQRFRRARSARLCADCAGTARST